MSITVQQLSDVAELSLAVRGGREGLSREVTWVHGSEVPDPTPWLSGGELLLTTGMRLSTSRDLDRFVHRLANVGAAGVGFAVGVAYEVVPSALVAAANRCGLPILEVPYETPFVAIAQTVSRRLAKAEHDRLLNAVRVQRQLIRSALDEGLHGIVPAIAGLVADWCVVADPDGYVMAAAPAEAQKRAGEMADELDNCRRNGLGAMAVAGPSGYTAVYPLVAKSHEHGFLLIGRDRPFEAPEQTVLSAAVTLLTLELEQNRNRAIADRHSREHLVMQVVRGELGLEGAARQVRSWGLDPANIEVLTVLDSAATTAESEQAEQLDQRLTSAGYRCVAAYADVGELCVLMDRPIEAEKSARTGWVGSSSSAGVANLPNAWRQARQAAAVGRAEGRLYVRFSDLEGLNLLFGLQESDALEGFVERVLGPVSDDPVLLSSLRVFLDNHGAWNAAAAQAGIHRHTLRARMDRVEHLLGRPLGASQVRAELILAIQARALIESKT